MIALLNAELVKLRTTRTFIGLTGIAVVISMALTTLVALLTEPTQESVLIDVYSSDTSSLFIVLLAVVAISGEWRHHTITSSLLAAPDRLRFLGAKTLAFSAAGLVMSVLISTMTATLGSIILRVRHLPLARFDDVASLAAHNALVAALVGAFGVGVGALLRNQVAAVVSLLVLTFAVEPVLLGLVPKVGRFGPFVALPTAASGVAPEDAGMAGVPLLSAGLGTLAMLGWIVGAFAIAGALLHLRDVD